MSTTMIAFLICLMSISIFGQEVKIPVDYKLDKVEDYAPYIDSVKMAANWMISNPLNQKREIRDQANKFVFRWVSGAPYTHIEIRPEFTSDVINDKSNIYSMDLLLNYIAGMTLVRLENKDSDEILTQEAGVKAMLNGYKSIRDDSKNKFLEKLLKLENKDELSAWIKENSINYEPKDKTKIIPKD